MSGWADSAQVELGLRFVADDAFSALDINHVCALACLAMSGLTSRYAKCGLLSFAAIADAHHVIIVVASSLDGLAYPLITRNTMQS